MAVILLSQKTSYILYPLVSEQMDHLIWLILDESHK